MKVKKIGRNAKDYEFVLTNNYAFSSVLTKEQIKAIAKKINPTSENKTIYLKSENLFVMNELIENNSKQDNANNLQIVDKGTGYSKDDVLKTKETEDGHWNIKVTQVDSSGGILDFVETKVDKDYKDLSLPVGSWKERKLSPLNTKKGASASGASVEGPFFVIIKRPESLLPSCCCKCCAATPEDPIADTTTGRNPLTKAKDKCAAINKLQDDKKEKEAKKMDATHCILSIEDFKTALGSSLDVEYHDPKHKESLCASYDYVTGSTRHCYAENRCYRLLFVLILLLTTLVTIYELMRVSLKGSSMPNSDFDNYLQENVRFPIYDGKRVRNLTHYPLMKEIKYNKNETNTTDSGNDENCYVETWTDVKVTNYGRKTCPNLGKCAVSTNNLYTYNYNCKDYCAAQQNISGGVGLACAYQYENSLLERCETDETLKKPKEDPIDIGCTTESSSTCEMFCWYLSCLYL